MAKINTKGITVNKRGMNESIKAHDIGEARFRELGFTDFSKANWFYVKMVSHGISFNVTINKKTLNLEIDVLYEDFLQPYDYQNVLEKDENNHHANKVHEKVQKIMKRLIEEGVISGYNMGDYI